MTFDFFEDERVVGVTSDTQVLSLGCRMNYGEVLHLRRLLRPRDERQCSRTADKRNELASSQAITASALARREGGTAMPSALAVLRLITSSIFVGRTTGKSAGFSPLRIRPV
jgi:hypothetical protein